MTQKSDRTTVVKLRTHEVISQYFVYDWTLGSNKSLLKAIVSFYNLGSFWGSSGWFKTLSVCFHCHKANLSLGEQWLMIWIWMHSHVQFAETNCRRHYIYQQTELWFSTLPDTVFNCLNCSFCWVKTKLFRYKHFNHNKNKTKYKFCKLKSL